MASTLEAHISKFSRDDCLDEEDEQILSGSEASLAEPPPPPEPIRPKTEEELYDTDLEVEEESGSRYRYLSSATIYAETCKQYNVVPVSFFERHLEDEVVRMRHHGLGPLGAKAIAVSLVSNTSVTELDLEDNWLEGQGGEYVADMLKENCYISSLSLANNRLGRRGALAISDMLQWNSSLMCLNLSNNGFSDTEAPELAEAIIENSRVRELDLSRNDFNQCGVILGHAFGENETLEVLDLSWNHFRYKSAIALVDGVGSSARLKSINLSWNGLSNEGAISLGKCLDSNTVLTSLDVSCNRFGPDAMIAISKGMEYNEALRVFKISDNHIGSVGALMLLQAVNNDRNVLQEIAFENIIVNKEFDQLHKEITDSGRSIAITHGGIISNYKIKLNPRYDLESPANPVKIIKTYLEEKSTKLDELFPQWAEETTSLPLTDFIKDIKGCFPLSDEQLGNLIYAVGARGQDKIQYTFFRSLVE